MYDKELSCHDLHQIALEIQRSFIQGEVHFLMYFLCTPHETLVIVNIFRDTWKSFSGVKTVSRSLHNLEERSNYL